MSICFHGRTSAQNHHKAYKSQIIKTSSNSRALISFSETCTGLYACELRPIEIRTTPKKSFSYQVHSLYIIISTQYFRAS